MVAVDMVAVDMVAVEKHQAASCYLDMDMHGYAWTWSSKLLRLTFSIGRQ